MQRLLHKNTQRRKLQKGPHRGENLLKIYNNYDKDSSSVNLTISVYYCRSLCLLAAIIAVSPFPLAVERKEGFSMYKDM